MHLLCPTRLRLGRFGRIGPNLVGKLAPAAVPAASSLPKVLARLDGILDGLRRLLCLFRRFVDFVIGFFALVKVRSIAILGRVPQIDIAVGKLAINAERTLGLAKNVPAHDSLVPGVVVARKLLGIDNCRLGVAARRVQLIGMMSKLAFFAVRACIHDANVAA